MQEMHLLITCEEVFSSIGRRVGQSDSERDTFASTMQLHWRRSALSFTLHCPRVSDHDVLHAEQSNGAQFGAWIALPHACIAGHLGGHGGCKYAVL